MRQCNVRKPGGEYEDPAHMHNYLKLKPAAIAMTFKLDTIWIRSGGVVEVLSRSPGRSFHIV